MVDFETELKVARDLFEKRLKTLKRIKHHIRCLEKSSDEYSAGEVALTIAKTELNAARHQLEEIIQSIRHRTCVSSTSLRPEATIDFVEDRDHFSEALDRVDPKSRLQLGR